MTHRATRPRAELPTSSRDLPPMGPDFEQAVERGLGELDLLDERAGSAAARRSYEAHARVLTAWNPAINLTAITDAAEIGRRHVIDSLAAVPALAARIGLHASLLDVGSGGGYPGLPLAAALGLARVGLLDSVAKKARFLAVAAEVVGDALVEADVAGADVAGADVAGADVAAPRIEVIHERAEDAAEEPQHRGAWDVVTARAVGSLAEVVELGMPLAREGGLVVAWKREDERDGLSAELREAGSIIRATGGGRPDVIVVAAASLPGHRLVLVPKLRPTPLRYPRPAGTRRQARRSPC